MALMRLQECSLSSRDGKLTATRSWPALGDRDIHGTFPSCAGRQQERQGHGVPGRVCVESDIFAGLSCSAEIGAAGSLMLWCEGVSGVSFVRTCCERPRPRARRVRCSAVSLCEGVHATRVECDHPSIGQCIQPCAVHNSAQGTETKSHLVALPCSGNIAIDSSKGSAVGTRPPLPQTGRWSGWAAAPP